MAVGPKRGAFRFVLGTLVDAIVSTVVVLVWWNRPDNSNGEGLAPLMFSGLLFAAVVFVWAGVEGWRGTILRWTLLRWLLVGVVVAVVLELVTVAQGDASPDAASIGLDLLISVPIALVLVLPPAAAGGIIGWVIGDRKAGRSWSEPWT